MRARFALGAPQAVPLSRRGHRIGCFSSDGLTRTLLSHMHVSECSSMLNVSLGHCHCENLQARPRTPARMPVAAALLLRAPFLELNHDGEPSHNSISTSELVW